MTAFAARIRTMLDTLVARLGIDAPPAQADDLPRPLTPPEALPLDDLGAVLKVHTALRLAANRIPSTLLDRCIGRRRRGRHLGIAQPECRIRCHTERSLACRARPLRELWRDC